MIFLEPLPFREAIAANEIKRLLPTSLSSRELSELDAELRRRARFSARVTDADFLQVIDDLVTPIAGGLREGETIEGAAGTRLLSIPEAKAQLGEFLRARGYRPENPGDEGTIKDLRTDARLQLIVETNVLDSMCFGQWQATQDETALDVNPGWQLVRFSTRRVPRDWAARWRDARTATSEEGATDGADGVMIALKNHPLWEALGAGAGGYEDTLGNPWPPFAFNSGMGVVDVPREECVQLGLLGEATQIPPESRGLNDNLQASGKAFSAAVQAALAADPELELRDGVLTLRRAA